MKEFTFVVLIVSEFLVGIFSVWLIILCKHLFTGLFTTCASIAACYGVYMYVSYIAEAIIWAVRFAAVIAIVAFVLGIYPKPRSADA